jgi:hypothetical protein
MTRSLNHLVTRSDAVTPNEIVIASFILRIGAIRSRSASLGRMTGCRHELYTVALCARRHRQYPPASTATPRFVKAALTSSDCLRASLRRRQGHFVKCAAVLEHIVRIDVFYRLEAYVLIRDLCLPSG